MEEIIISVREFLLTIASPHGLQLENIERTFRQEIAGGKDFGIIVGAESKRYTIPVEALKKYFEEKAKPRADAPVDKDAFADFMKDVPAAPPAPAPPEKAPKNVVK